MKKNSEHIDDLIKSKLEGREFGAPPMDFLDDLNQRLDQREKKPLFGPWNNLFDVLLLLLIILYPFMSSTENKINISTNEHSTIVNQSKVNDQNEKEKASLTISLEVNKEYIPTDLDKTVEEESDQSSSISSGTGIDRTVNNAIRVKNEPPNFLTQKSVNTTDKAAEKNHLTNKKRTNTKETSLEVIENQIGGINPGALQVNGTMLSSRVYASQFNIIEPKIRNWNFPPILGEDTGLSAQQRSETLSENLRSPLSWELQLSAGINFPMLIQPNGLQSNAKLLSSQSGTQLSLTMGLRTGLWYNKLNVTSGVDFMSIREENNFEFNTIESYDSSYVSSVDTTVVFDSTNQQFDTVYIYNYDTINVTDTTQTLLTINHQYNWIQLPIQFGYRFQLNKWAIIPRAGMNVAIGIRQQNKVYPNSSYDDLQSYAPNVKALINLTGSLEVRRFINDWHVFVRGDYQSGMRPVLSGDYFERRYNGFSLSMGVGVKL